MLRSNFRERAIKLLLDKLVTSYATRKHTKHFESFLRLLILDLLANGSANPMT